MKPELVYDDYADILQIKLVPDEERNYLTSKELGNGYIVDLAKDGSIISIEIMDLEDKINESKFMKEYRKRVKFIFETY